MIFLVVGSSRTLYARVEYYELFIFSIFIVSGAPS